MAGLGYAAKGYLFIFLIALLLDAKHVRNVLEDALKALSKQEDA